MASPHDQLRGRVGGYTQLRLIWLHHHIDQAFPIFLAHVKKTWEGLDMRLPQTLTTIIKWCTFVPPFYSSTSTNVCLLQKMHKLMCLLISTVEFYVSGQKQMIHVHICITHSCVSPPTRPHSWSSHVKIIFYFIPKKQTYLLPHAKKKNTSHVIFLLSHAKIFIPLTLCQLIILTFISCLIS